jgi:hypothetical protein
MLVLFERRSKIMPEKIDFQASFLHERLSSRFDPLFFWPLRSLSNQCNYVWNEIWCGVLLEAVTEAEATS